MWQSGLRGKSQPKGFPSEGRILPPPVADAGRRNERRKAAEGVKSFDFRPKPAPPKERRRAMEPMRHKAQQAAAQMRDNAELRG